MQEYIVIIDGLKIPAELTPAEAEAIKQDKDITVIAL